MTRSRGSSRKQSAPEAGIAGAEIVAEKIRPTVASITTGPAPMLGGAVVADA